MKARLIALLVVARFLSAANTWAADIAWTNISGGNWSDNANWNPNRVPTPGDNAIITANGTYTVTLDTSATITSLTLGASSGSQTLTTAGNTRALIIASSVNANGVLELSGGALCGGGMLTVRGSFKWTDGTLDSLARVTVAAGGVLNLAGNGGKNFNEG